VSVRSERVACLSLQDVHVPFGRSPGTHAGAACVLSFVKAPVAPPSPVCVAHRTAAGLRALPMALDLCTPSPFPRRRGRTANRVVLAGAPTGAYAARTRGLAPDAAPYPSPFAVPALPCPRRRTLSRRRPHGPGFAVEARGVRPSSSARRQRRAGHCGQPLKAANWNSPRLLSRPPGRCGPCSRELRRAIPRVVPTLVVPAPVHNTHIRAYFTQPTAPKAGGAPC
jgi:hypothetical protein